MGGAPPPVTATTLSVDDGSVDAAVHHPPSPGRTGVLLTHGAGGDLDAAGLVPLAEGLAAAGLTVVRANLPYRQAGRPLPPRADRAVPGLRRILEEADALVGGLPWVLGGKSYGGRVASLAVASGTAALGLLLYGYPLHPAGEPERLRVGHWPDIAVPCCFLQGTRDRLCGLDLLRDNLGLLPVPPRLEVVEGGDHSLHVRGMDRPDGCPAPPAEVLAGLAPGVAAWIAGLPRTDETVV